MIRVNSRSASSMLATVRFGLARSGLC